MLQFLPGSTILLFFGHVLILQSSGSNFHRQFFEVFSQGLRSRISSNGIHLAFELRNFFR